jgi:hypothetical protein
MGQVAMTVLSLQEAVERTGTSQVDIWRAIQAGTLSAKKTDHGGFAIDPNGLFAVFETKQADQYSMAEDAAPSVEASQSRGTSPTPETDATTDATVVFGALTTEPKSLPERLPQAPASDEPRQNRDERPTVDLAERNAQLSEPAAERAKVEKMGRYVVLADEHDGPWWRRLVGWIRTRRGRAARKRLRERLYG